MIICIGPICIPLWGLLPLIAAFLAPYWAKLKQWLGWTAPPETPTAATTATEGDASSEQDAPATSLEDEPAAMPPTAVRRIDSEDDWAACKAEAQSHGWVMVVDFGATWCKPCQALKPAFHSAAAKRRALFVEVDVDDTPEIAEEYQVAALPTVLILRDGKEVTKKTGPNADSLTALVNEHATAR
ncbi:uncharacterized protein MONBRDRAFT_28276 [Monosiga brevicollis MX1]|uniref:Thioredoxin domain-containing protein n=1 Tax=Monosiga brevicollis TaxID=81824 RepID=A9V7P6_MONBE|nr:uncharacterized protein MONBRDRAFT_28276 [Monosiga brevicollis MX1]EDQ86412.1 predicted protein [Monosiga brevicollis MX1]|eukprot:XP_001748802.1 hypothetical protein [Monosiga brevicollis MX1]